jgi:hypothetical protein
MIYKKEESIKKGEKKEREEDSPPLHICYN